MPKIKTHKGLGKRVKVTKTGKLKRRMSFAGHMMSGKSGKRRRRLRNAEGITGAAARTSKRMLGIG